MQHERLVQGIRELYSRTTRATRALANHTGDAVDQCTIASEPETIYGIFNSLGISGEDSARSRLGTVECAACGQDFAPSSYHSGLTTRSDLSSPLSRGVDDTSDVEHSNTAISIPPSGSIPSPRLSPTCPSGFVLPAETIEPHETSSDFWSKRPVTQVAVTPKSTSVRTQVPTSTAMCEYTEFCSIGSLHWSPAVPWSDHSAMLRLSPVRPDQYHGADSVPDTWY